MTPKDARGEEDHLRGQVLQGVGGVYSVLLENGSQAEASLRGRLKRQVRTGDRVVAGDHVIVARWDAETLTIEEVLDRHNELVRSGPGGRRPKVVAANLDQVLIVVSALAPAVERQTVDRFLVLAEVNHIPPILVFNKMDLDGASEAAEPLVRLYRRVGYPVLLTSCVTKEGLDELRTRMEGRVSALAGPSGVGKSSLLNAMEPGLDLRIGRVSERKGRGRHTTVSAKLLILAKGLKVVDTPGFSEATAWGVAPRGVSWAFPEFRALADECRFRGCTHVHEPDCAVQTALAEGRIDAGRYDSYLRILEAELD
jgi:ribosome biogenesis GTPase / thiamine phosphate phosphatase